MSAFQYAIISGCGPLAQLVRAEDLTGRFLPLGIAKERKHSIGLLKVSSLCLEVELLKFGERCGTCVLCQRRAKLSVWRERVETRREGRKARQSPDHEPETGGESRSGKHNPLVAGSSPARPTTGIKKPRTRSSSAAFPLPPILCRRFVEVGVAGGMSS